MSPVADARRESLDDFRGRARTWLDANAERRPASRAEWGTGSDSVALFRNDSVDDERAHIDALRRWIQRKSDAGFANLSWDVRWGGGSLEPSFDRAFENEERTYATPPTHEVCNITIGLIAPTIRAVGTAKQHERFLRPMLRTDELWCQLFSEPGAGSDLAGLSTRAERDGDDWVLNGQKVWTSGALFADWGYILCRTDPSVPKHRGITAFALPMEADGVDIRPLRQMTGGSSFSEVFLSDVRLRDEHRLGDIGAGWKVALTTLGFERSMSGWHNEYASAWQLVDAARHFGLTSDLRIRQLLATAYSLERVRLLTGRRVNARLSAGVTPGPEGSIGKLSWTESLRQFSTVAGAILGPSMVADTGAWGTYAWSEFVLGTSGYRVAGGTDEVQRTIIAERALGLPPEPRVDRSATFQPLDYR